MRIVKAVRQLPGPENDTVAVLKVAVGIIVGSEGPWYVDRVCVTGTDLHIVREAERVVQFSPVTVPDRIRVAAVKHLCAVVLVSDLDAHAVNVAHLAALIQLNRSICLFAVELPHGKNNRKYRGHRPQKPEQLFKCFISFHISCSPFLSITNQQILQT